jgi:hypothetical protein
MNSGKGGCGWTDKKMYHHPVLSNIFHLFQKMAKNLTFKRVYRKTIPRPGREKGRKMGMHGGEGLE